MGTPQMGLPGAKHEICPLGEFTSPRGRFITLQKAPADQAGAFCLREDRILHRGEKSDWREKKSKGKEKACGVLD